MRFIVSCDDIIDGCFRIFEKHFDFYSTYPNTAKYSLNKKIILELIK